MEDKAMELVKVQDELQLLALACRGANRLPEEELATAPDIFYSLAERLDSIAATLGKMY